MHDALGAATFKREGGKRGHGTAARPAPARGGICGMALPDLDDAAPFLHAGRIVGQRLRNSGQGLGARPGAGAERKRSALGLLIGHWRDPDRAAARFRLVFHPEQLGRDAGAGAAPRAEMPPNDVVDGNWLRHCQTLSACAAC